MPDKKLTDNEIVKALECCSKPVGENCKECPLHLTDCLKVNIEELALDLINRLQAENEELKSAINGFRGYEDKIKAEAYKEFAERLKTIMYENYQKFDEQPYPMATISIINNLLKELVCENK